MNILVAALAAFYLGMLFERWGCRQCRNLIGSTDHAEAVSRAMALPNLEFGDHELLDEVRVYLNRRVCEHDWKGTNGPVVGCIRCGMTKSTKG